METRIPHIQIQIVRETIDPLIQNDEYRHYLQIPDRVCKFLDHFQFQYDRNKVREALSTYFLWLKIVDDEIDRNNFQIGYRIVDRLKNPEIEINDQTVDESALLLTELLKVYLDRTDYSIFTDRLEELYDSVIEERESSEIQQYIESRKKVGRLTAECAYRIITPYLSRHQERFLEFFQRLGSLGSLVDSIIDIKRDTEKGILRFKPSHIDRIKLYSNTFQEGIRLFLEHPNLYGTFLRSTVNTIRDKYI